MKIFENSKMMKIVRPQLCPQEFVSELEDLKRRLKQKTEITEALRQELKLAHVRRRELQLTGRRGHLPRRHLALRGG